MDEKTLEEFKRLFLEICQMISQKLNLNSINSYTITTNGQNYFSLYNRSNGRRGSEDLTPFIQWLAILWEKKNKAQNVSDYEALSKDFFDLKDKLTHHLNVAAQYESYGSLPRLTDQNRFLVFEDIIKEAKKTYSENQASIKYILSNMEKELFNTQRFPDAVNVNVNTYNEIIIFNYLDLWFSDQQQILFPHIFNLLKQLECEFLNPLKAIDKELMVQEGVQENAIGLNYIHDQKTTREQSQLLLAQQEGCFLLRINANHQLVLSFRYSNSFTHTILHLEKSGAIKTIVEGQEVTFASFGAFLNHFSQVLRKPIRVGIVNQQLALNYLNKSDAILKTPTLPVEFYQPTFIDSWLQRKNHNTFYRTIRILLSQRFLTGFTLASQWLKTSKSGALGKVGSGLKTGSEAAHLIPMIGAVPAAIAKLLGILFKKVDEKIQAEKFAIFNKLGTLPEIEEFVDSFAFYLTVRYSDILNHYSDQTSAIETLALTIADTIFETLLNEKFEFSQINTLGQHLISALEQSHQRLLNPITQSGLQTYAGVIIKKPASENLGFRLMSDEEAKPLIQTTSTPSNASNSYAFWVASSQGKQPIAQQKQFSSSMFKSPQSGIGFA